MNAKKAATLADVAVHAHVSSATVSRVLHNTGPVSEDLRRRIEASVSELGYAPHRASRRRTQGTLALFVEHLLNPFFPEFIRGVQDEVDNHGTVLTLYQLADRPALASQVLEKLSRQTVDGIIMAGSVPVPELLKWRERNKVPMVVIDRRIPLPGVHCIGVDFAAAMYQATRHLLSLNHTRIGHLATPRTSEISDSRFRGIESALREAGLTLRPEWCPIVPPGSEVDGGFQAMRGLLELPPEDRPTAVLAFNDIIAVGALHAINACGLRVPQDISIVGVDDISIAAHVCPPLTTIGQPKYRMGKLAVQTWHHMCEGNMRPGNNCTLLESPLIVRESSGPAPVGRA